MRQNISAERADSNLSADSSTLNHLTDPTATVPITALAGNGGAPGAAASNGHGATEPGPAADSGPVVVPDGSPVVRAEQDQEIAGVISGTRKAITIALGDAIIAEVLARKGFTETKLNAGLDLCKAAQTQWDARQTAIGYQAQCTATVNGRFAEAVNAYAGFRETARAELKDEASLKALSVTDAVPKAFDPFLTHARGAYHCAQQEPYATVLGNAGYTAAVLADHLKALAALDTANQEQAKAIAEAQKATRLRDEAAVPVREFGTNLRQAARRVFRQDPEQARKLEL